MNFASDNWAGATEQVSRALADAAPGLEAAYGNDSLTRQVTETFCGIFETDVTVFFTGTGSAANSLALSAYMKPSGVILCHKDSHIFADECGAPEFLTNGAKLLPLDGLDTKLEAQIVADRLAKYGPTNARGGRAVAVSVTQLTESGTAYQPEHLSAIGAHARAAGVGYHMDGARFANALVTLGCSPAEMSWKTGVDALSFGATKNGCWCAEAIVFFDKAKAEAFDYYRARSGHRFSKGRFIAAQFLGYFADDHWLETARYTNRMAARLAVGLGASANGRLAWQSDGNEVFAVVSRQRAAGMLADGAMFYEWPVGYESLSESLGGDEAVYRLVTSFATREQDVDAFVKLLDTG